MVCDQICFLITFLNNFNIHLDLRVHMILTIFEMLRLSSELYEDSLLNSSQGIYYFDVCSNSLLGEWPGFVGMIYYIASMCQIFSNCACLLHIINILVQILWKYLPDTSQ